MAFAATDLKVRVLPMIALRILSILCTLSPGPASFRGSSVPSCEEMCGQENSGLHSCHVAWVDEGTMQDKTQTREKGSVTQHNTM